MRMNPIFFPFDLQKKIKTSVSNLLYLFCTDNWPTFIHCQRHMWSGWWGTHFMKLSR